MSGRVSGYVGLCIKSPSGESSATVVEESFKVRERGEWKTVFAVALGRNEKRTFWLTSVSCNFILSISDVGRFIITTEDNPDWDKSVVWIYDEHLSLIMEKRVPVMVWSAAVSADGSVCCYTTDVSCEASVDQCCFLLSCDDGRSLSSFNVGNLFGHGVLPVVKSIDSSSVTFELGDGEFLAVVSHKGELLNKAPYFLYRRDLAYASKHGYSLFYLSEEATPGEALEMLHDALKKELDQKTNAKVWRRIGERLQDGFCKYQDAIEAYEKALSLDENVGAKRRLAACLKNVSGKNRGVKE